MNPRNVIIFLRSPTGALLCFGVIFIAAILLMRRFHDPQNREPDSKAKVTASNKTKNKPQILESIVKQMVPFRPSLPDEPKNLPLEPAPKEAKKADLTPISLFPEIPLTAPEPKHLSTHYAPYGRLIPCELIVTIDSSSIRTPLIGLITEDIYHDGRLIIPAGTEVHGTAQQDRTRERIASNGEWTLVWQSGEELSLSGIALDREKNADNEGWALTDGSAGLRGHILKSDSLAEIKLFAATFLSGSAEALTEKQQTIFGTQTLPSLQNAPFKGAQGVLNVYARQILETIQRDGFYVRVPAGKQFYLYVTQTIDRDDALVGGHHLGGGETNQRLSPNPSNVVSAKEPMPVLVPLPSPDSSESPSVQSEPSKP